LGAQGGKASKYHKTADITHLTPVILHKIYEIIGTTGLKMFLEISVQVMFKLHQLGSEPLVNCNLKAIPQMLSQTEVRVFTPLNEN